MPDALESFLAAIGLDGLAPDLRAAGLDHDRLLELTDSQLAALGVSPGDRARILAARSAEEEGFVVAAASGGWQTTSRPWEATRKKPFVNCLGMLFVPIPRYKTLFSICPVRVCDYESYCRKIGLPMPECDFPQQPDHPMVNVTWDQACAFCDWITLRERGRGALDDDLVYRLPTDLEWSAAVGLPHESPTTPKSRSGRLAGYPWGTGFPPPSGDGNYSPLLKVDEFPETSPVASFTPNALGIQDLGGNAWEWCMDFYDRENRERVARGASCFNDAEELLRSSHRDHIEPSRHRNNLGFRVVLSASLYQDPRHRLQNNPWG